MPDSALTSATSSPYLEQIKGELTNTVLSLKARLSNDRRITGDAQQVLASAKLHLGYTIVMHQGFPFITEGSTYCGFPVVIDRSSSRAIWLRGKGLDGEEVSVTTCW